MFYFIFFSQVLIRKGMTLEDTAGLAWNNISALTPTATANFHEKGYAKL